MSEYRWLPFRRSGGLSTPTERPNSEYPIYFIPETGAMSVESIGGAVEIWPVDSEGVRRVWRQTRPSLQAAIDRGDMRVVINGSGDDARYTVQMKDRIKEGRKFKTVWVNAKYDASTHGTILLMDMFGSRGQFSYPKSLYSVTDALRAALSHGSSEVVFDYFAGSGTTAHAVINLNREDEGARKYILVEMGEYFDSVLKPRVLKAVYSKGWKDGKPVSREGISQLIKVIRLESYEDTLNNLRVHRSERQARLLGSHEELREQYTLCYWLSEETKGSASLLKIDGFEDPLSYSLDVGQGSAAETQPVTVDLVETFNYLTGLRVRHVDRIRGVTMVQGTLPPSPGRPSGENALVIWRNTREMNAEALDDFLWSQRINPRDMEFDLIYVNGDNHLENSRRENETWKVRLIEDEFQRLMFETAEQERK